MRDILNRDVGVVDHICVTAQFNNGAFVKVVPATTL